MPRPPDMAIFLLTTTTTRPITLPLAHACGVNIQALDAEAFTSDHTLHHELMQIPNKKSLGVVLISSRETCLRCHSTVSVRKDRPALITVYDDKIGTAQCT